MANYTTSTKYVNTTQVTQINVHTNNITQKSKKQILFKLRETSVGE
jgi:hypothetical protein